MMFQTLIGGKPASGKLHFFGLVHGNGLFEQHVHSGQKGDAQVDFRKTEKAPVRAHKPKVKGATQNGPPGKGVPVDSRHSKQGIGEHPLEYPVEQVEKGLGPVDVFFLDDRNQPIQIDAVGENLFVCRANQKGGGGGVGLDGIQGVENSGEKCRVEPVFAAVQRQDRHRFIQCVLNQSHVTLP
jgi:hypothetical protein